MTTTTATATTVAGSLEFVMQAVPAGTVALVVPTSMGTRPWTAEMLSDLAVKHNLLIIATDDPEHDVRVLSEDDMRRYGRVRA